MWFTPWAPWKIVSGSVVLAIAMTAIVMLAQRMSTLKENGVLDVYATLPVSRAAVVGSVEVKGQDLTVRARSIRIEAGRMSPEILESGPLTDIFAVYGRVARTLLDMSEMDGEIKVIRNKVSRQDLAKVVGASREMVSRVMKDLEGRGMVQTQENGWVIIKEQLTG